MKYKKFSNVSSTTPKISPVSINSLDEIPLPNEIEIETTTDNVEENILHSEISCDSDIGNNDISSTDRKSCNLLNKLFKNTSLDDILLLAILVLLLQEDSPDEVLTLLIYILLFNK